MERKGGATLVVSAETIEQGLKSVKTSPREDQVLRMRHGVSVSKKTELPQAHGGNEELEDELLLIEMSLLRALKRRALMAAPKASKPAISKSAVTKSQAGKQKIISALKSRRK